MLLNLKKALNDKNISLKALGSFLGISEKAAYNKINESSAFTYPEARSIKKELLPEYDMDYLFAPNGEGEVR